MDDGDGPGLAYSRFSDVGAFSQAGPTLGLRQTTTEPAVKQPGALKPLKVLLLGSKGAGKSSVLQTLIRGVVPPRPSRSTVGLEVHLAEIALGSPVYGSDEHPARVTLEVWDKGDEEDRRTVELAMG